MQTNRRFESLHASMFSDERLVECLWNQEVHAGIERVLTVL